MKIILGGDSYTPVIDGVVVCMKNYYKFLSKKNKVKLVIPAYGKYDFKDKNIFPVTSLLTPIGAPYPLSLPNVCKNKLWNFLDNFKPDIIHIHAPFIIGKYLTKYAKEKKIPIVLTFHTKFYDDFIRVTKFKVLAKMCLKYIMNVVNKVDHVFILNENNIKVLKDYGIKHTKNISILENGCDFMNDNKKAIKNKVFTFGFVGRMLKYKGLENIIQSIKILATKTKKFKVLIIGDGDDLQWMKNEVKKNKLENFFHFTGLITDREELKMRIKQLDLFMLLNNFDNSSLVIKECACYNIPTIFLENATVSSGIKDGHNGFLVSEDWEKISNKLFEIMSDKEKTALVGKNANKTLFRTWSKAVSEAEVQYKKIIKSYKKK